MSVYGAYVFYLTCSRIRRNRGKKGLMVEVVRKEGRHEWAQMDMSYLNSSILMTKERVRKATRKMGEQAEHRTVQEKKG